MVMKSRAVLKRLFLETLRHGEVRFAEDLGVLRLERVPHVIAFLFIELELQDLLFQRTIFFFNGVANDLSDHLLVSLHLLVVRYLEARWSSSLVSCCRTSRLFRLF